MTGFDVVTGAFSYSGAAIAQRTAGGGPAGAHAHRPSRPGPQTAAAGGIEVRPLDFADPAALTESMRGAGTLYNTYWVRFARGASTTRWR